MIITLVAFDVLYELNSLVQLMSILQQYFPYRLTFNYDNKSRCRKNQQYYISGHHNLQTISTSSKVFFILEWSDATMFDPCGV